MVFTAQHGLQDRTLTIFIPRDLVAPVSAVSALSARKHNGYVTVSFDCPRRARTTGPLSQNHAIHGYATQIERWMDDGTTKREIIEEAMARAAIPHRTNRFGREVFKHEADLSIEEAAAIINELTEIAQFLGCPLIGGGET